MSKKYNIFGGIKFWGKFDFKWPRMELGYFFRSMLKWDWAAWFWFILLFSIVSMGVGAVLIQMIGDPTPVVPTQSGWDG